jgi:plasmid maintenance system antidote protein VapI
MAIRFGKAFGTTPQFWLNIQDDYDLEKVTDDIPAGAETIQQLVAA